MKDLIRLSIVFVLLMMTAVSGFSFGSALSPDASAETALETAAVASEANRFNYHAFPCFSEGLLLGVGGITLVNTPYYAPVGAALIGGAGGSILFGTLFSFVPFPAEITLRQYNNEKEANKDWTQEQRDERALFYLEKAARMERVWSIIGGVVPIVEGSVLIVSGISSMSYINSSPVMSARDKEVNSGTTLGLAVFPGALMVIYGVVQAAFERAPAELALIRYKQAKEENTSAKLDFYINPFPGNSSAGFCVTF